MVDNIENHTLRLLQEMRTEMQGMRTELQDTRTEMREGFAELRQRQNGVEERLSLVEGSLAKVIGAVTEIAKVQEKHSGILLELVESDRIAGARLNAVEGRLGRIEKQTGLALQ